MSPAPDRPARRDRQCQAALIPGLLTLACFYFFYALNSGITITNDGSHFALFDALVTTGSPELKNVRQFAFGDSAIYENRFYSDRNPGLALGTSVFYQGTRSIEGWMKPLFLDPKFERNYQQGQKRKIAIVMLIPALSGALLLLLGFLLSRELGVSYYPAPGSASVFAPYGGWDRDYRYFCAALPLLAPFPGTVLEYLMDTHVSRVKRLVRQLALAAFAISVAFSISIQLEHLRHPGQIQYSQLLVNAEASMVNISLFLALLACLSLPIILIWNWLRRETTTN